LDFDKDEIENRQAELKQIIKKFNIKINPYEPLPVEKLVSNFAAQENSFLKFKKQSNMTRALGLDKPSMRKSNQSEILKSLIDKLNQKSNGVTKKIKIN
jgi:hypothetical protein